MIDYDAYTNMDQKELEKMVVHIKNILHLREKALIESVIKKDLISLKKSLENNKEKILSEKAWNNLNFKGITEKNLDFFLYVRCLPDFEKNDVHVGNLTKTEQALCAAFQNYHLFDFFVNNKEFSQSLKWLVDEYAVNREAPIEIIERLFSHELIKPDAALLSVVLERKCFNFIEYFINNNIYNFTSSDYKNIYAQAWKNGEVEILEILRGKTEEYKQFSLKDLVKLVDINSFVKDGDYERYKSFLKFDSKLFIDSFKYHIATKEDITQIIFCFNNLSPKENNKFEKLMELFVAEFPEHLEAVKESKLNMTSRFFKNVYEKTMEYIELHMKLERKDNNNEKKIKI